MKITAIVLAAGKGSRMKSKIEKQFMLLGDYPVLYYALKTFEKSPVDEIILVTGKDNIDYCRKEIVEKYHLKKVHSIIEGGANRYDSVYQGLQACGNTDFVIIHDGARPFVTVEMIDILLETLKTYKACTVGMPVKDTIKIVDENGIGIDTPARNTLWQIQTPQGFDYGCLLSCYQKMMAETPDVTDDTMVVERYGNEVVKVVEGGYFNIKITTPEDMKIGLEILKNFDAF